MGKERHMLEEYMIIEMLYRGANVIIDAAFCQDYDALNRSIKSFFMPAYQSLLQGILTDQNGVWGRCSAGRGEQLLQITELLLEAQEQQDYLLLADYLELFLMPVLGELMESIRDSVNFMEEIDYRQDNASFFPEYPRPEEIRGYQIELTQQGPLTIRRDGNAGSFYFHSNVNPWKDAARWVGTYGEDTAEEYAVLGLGLGYHVITLWIRTQGAVPIHVYEPEASVMILAERYQDFSVCEGRNLYLHYDPDMQMFTEKLADSRATLAIHYPSMRNMQNIAQKEALEKFFVADSSRRRQAKYLHANFISNSRSDARPVEELRDEFAGKDVFIIAAGPSLDKNVELLQKRSDRSIVLATGTVFRKLMRMGIRPDYVVVTDASKRIFGQVFNQYKNEQVPLLVLSSAYYRLCAEYNGPKYLILQKDFVPAEKYASKNEYTLFETGGSVSTIALDVCIRFQAARIIFLGLDLAFTDNLAHANGTSNRIATDQAVLQPVKAYNGGVVYSDSKFNLYTEWIERRIRQEDARAISIINATEGGRYIRGMEYGKLSEILEEP